MTSPAVLGAAAVVVAAGSGAYGTYYHNSSLFGRTISRLPAGDRAVSITFDDGPNPESTPHILDTLARERVAATFFVLGRHAELWPELVERMASEGHELGNHGWHHRKLHVHGPAYIRRDLRMGTDAIEAACARQPRLFRAPHGFRNPWVTPIAHSLGQATVGWSLGVWDSAKPGVNVIARRAINGARAGSILLLHDGDGYDPAGDRMQTALALPAIIAGLRDRGLHFRTVLSA